ncbi:unnamed protein product [Phytophthora lilii]|uniref:Unnamed protein product n=1 Tax=Phytophthora lilii TaxID=2077276 RepID=A0A9W6WWX3_9STRA|nr:unnamed protein product [Phytophthora lilii]
MLTSKSRGADVKIIDFGLAKLLDADDKTASFLGTRGYLAPEMLQRQAYSMSVDMWALGIIVYVLLCGCLPFDDDGGKIANEKAARVHESEDEWKPGADEEASASEEDGELSDEASSEEEMAKRRVRARVNKRKVIDSDSSDQNETARGPRAKVKMKKVKHTTKMLPTPPPVNKNQSAAAAVKRVVAAVKTEAKRNGATALHPANVKDEVLDAHRRPMKQQKRANMQMSADRRAQHTTVSYSGVPPNHTLDNFFDEILEWKFYEALRRETQSSHSHSTTNANDGTEEGEIEIEVEKVPSKFRSYEHYFSVWKPLALEEVQAQTINAVTTDLPNPIPIGAKGLLPQGPSVV